MSFGDDQVTSLGTFPSLLYLISLNPFPLQILQFGLRELPHIFVIVHTKMWMLVLEVFFEVVAPDSGCRGRATRTV